MNIFLNVVTSNWIIIIFDNSRQIIDSENISILWQESTTLIDIIDIFLSKNKLKYEDINNIVVVNWPGSFTWVRTIVLVVNTLSYIYKNIILTPISYFDLFSNYPIVKISSKRDLFVKTDKNNIIEIISNEDFLKSFWFGIFEWEYVWNWEYNANVDYEKIIKNVWFSDKKQIEANYIKKPSIS